MDKRILVTGATGLIGKRLVESLCRQGALIKIISTDVNNTKKIFSDIYAFQVFDWKHFDDAKLLARIVDESDIIVNLAGRNIASKRWNNKFKKEIYESRVGITNLIVEAIKYSGNKPEALINSSAAGIYGFRGDEIINEGAGLGDDFLARLCRDWETEAFKAVKDNVRVVTVRSGIVLAKDEGALKKLLKPFRFFGGVYLGNGRQWTPWIHIDDIISLYEFAIDNTGLSGGLNGVAPQQVTNKELIGTIGEVLGKKLLIGAPSFAMKMALGEMANNLLTGQKCFPAKAISHGYKFKFPELKSALENLLLN